MDDAIYIKKSVLGFSLNLFGICLATYWIAIADASLFAKISACFCIFSCLIYIWYRNRAAGNLVGKVSLTSVGFLPLKKGTNTPYQASLHQMLPWCLHIKLVSQETRFEKLIWRDALCRDDWRKLRVYLLEGDNKNKSTAANKPKLDRG